VGSCANGDQPRILALIRTCWCGNARGDDGTGWAIASDYSRSVRVRIRAMPNLDSVIQQLRAERDRLDRAIAALESMADSTAPRRAGRRGSARRRRRRTMSPAARRRIAAAQRARWKKFRASQRSVGGKTASQKTRGRRHISAEGLATIRAAQRKRWAKVRAGKKK
jgi:hypothetical protein